MANISFPGTRNWSYPLTATIDFNKMCQISSFGGKERKIRAPYRLTRPSDVMLANFLHFSLYPEKVDITFAIIQSNNSGTTGGAPRTSGMSDGFGSD